MVDGVRRPFRCRWGFHRYGLSYRDRRLTTMVRWRTTCTRCGALLCYSAEPFIVERRWFGIPFGKRMTP